MTLCENCCLIVEAKQVFEDSRWIIKCPICESEIYERGGETEDEKEEGISNS